MQFFFSYLYHRRKVLLLLFFFLFLFAVSFWLYRLPVEAVAYPALICAAIGLAVLILGSLRASRKHRLLVRLADSLTELPRSLPEPRTQDDEDYQLLVGALCEEQRRLKSTMELRYADMIDYYTVWAHQIKTPIAGMKLLLEEEEIDRAALRRELLRTEQYVETALQYQRLHGVTNDLLIKSYPVEEMVRQALKRTSTLFLHKKVSVNLWNLAGTVITDEKWFVFVLEQLISNAAKYTRNGQISVYMPEGIRKLLIIEDTGIGIRREDLPRIFEWGYTGENGRIDKKATGIGLALCKETLKMLGHGISVESEPGKGTKITLDLTQ